MPMNLQTPQSFPLRIGKHTRKEREEEWEVRVLNPTLKADGVQSRRKSQQDTERDTGETRRVPGSQGAMRTRTTEVTQTRR